MSEHAPEELPEVVAEPEDEGNPDEMVGDFVDDPFIAEEDKEVF